METAPSGGSAAGAGLSYADSVDSSPRSRGGESWDEPFPSSAAAAAAASKLRLMCSYGGHIVPRPTDKTLCYLGGETRIVVVDRHSTLSDLHERLSRSLLGGRPFSLKYQLPSEDLDSLISVTTDEDLDNMIEEYDRIVSSSSDGSGGGGSSHHGTTGGGKSSRLRLFLFPSKPESSDPSSSSIGSLLDDSKSETWFVDALNSAMVGMLPRGLSSADSAASSINCLLGLDDSNPFPNNGGGGIRNAAAAASSETDRQQALFLRADSSEKLGGGGESRHGGQDVHSVPDSPMLETASSFGSASSAPFLSNLPPIRVRAEDKGSDLRAIGVGLDEHFAQLNVSGQKQQIDAEGFNHLHHHYAPTTPPPINPITLTTAATTNFSPTENPSPSRVFSSDDDKSEQGGVRRPPPQQQQQQAPQQQQQQQKSNVLDLPISGDMISRPVYYQERPPASDPKQEAPVSVSDANANYRVQVQVTEPGYVLQPPQLMQAEQLQQQQQLQLQQQQQQLQLQQHQQKQQQQLQQQQQQQLQQHQQQHQQQQLQQHQQQQLLQQFVQVNPHLVPHHHATGQVVPTYYPMPGHPQQHLPQAAHPYNQQIPMYYLPARQNPAYDLPMQPNLGDIAAHAPVPSGKPTIPLPSTVLQPGPTPLPKPELAANIYRTGTAPSVAQPPPQPTQLIHMTDQPHQYMGYHPVHHHPSQAVVTPAAAASYGYDYADAAHAQQMYYNQAVSALPPQYQTMSSVMAESPPALQQPTDVKQTRAS